MADELAPKPPERVRRRRFQKGRSGNLADRPTRSRKKTTVAAAALLQREAEALTRKAVELALGGDPTAVRLCLERILPPCRERVRAGACLVRPGAPPMSEIVADLPHFSLLSPVFRTRNRGISIG